MAGLLQAPLRDFANLLKALIDDKGGVPDDAPSTDEPAPTTTDAEAPAAGPTPDAEAPAAADTTDAADDAAPRPTPPHPHGGKLIMATKEEILDSIANLTVLELSELLKEFEEKFGVTAAAAAPVFAGSRRRRRRRRGRRGGAGRVRRRPHRRRRQEDPGHQGGALAHEPRSQGGQGPRGRRPQGRPREGQPRKTPRRPRRPSRPPAPPSSSSRTGSRPLRTAVCARRPSPGRGRRRFRRPAGRYRARPMEPPITHAHVERMDDDLVVSWRGGDGDVSVFLSDVGRRRRASTCATPIAPAT